MSSRSALVLYIINLVVSEALTFAEAEGTTIVDFVLQFNPQQVWQIVMPINQRCRGQHSCGPGPEIKRVDDLLVLVYMGKPQRQCDGADCTNQFYGRKRSWHRFTSN